MKNFLKYLGIGMAVVVLAVAGLLTYVKTALPNVKQAEEIKIDYTQERIQRGEYLANTVTVCMDCHSKRDWSKFSGPPMEGTLGMGGDRFDQSMGMPGVFFAKNITPSGMQRYTDGELYRVITTGVTKEGHALFPLMPYPYYAKMDPEDVYDIIAYIRSLEPIENNVPDSEPDFPLSFILNTIPKDTEPGKRPDKSQLIEYGGYLTTIAGCAECHTPVKQGQIIPELMFSGGREFAFPDGSVLRSVNITPDKTGIGLWTEEMFVQRFKMYGDSTYVPSAVKPGDYNSIMPWTMYGKMKEADLKAIYAYLKTVAPMENTVERFTPTGK